jgi:hypothetical protein
MTTDQLLQQLRAVLPASLLTDLGIDLDQATFEQGNGLVYLSVLGSAQSNGVSLVTEIVASSAWQYVEVGIYPAIARPRTLFPAALVYHVAQLYFDDPTQEMIARVAAERSAALSAHHQLVAYQC